MLERLGERGRKFVEDNLVRFDKHGREWLTWKLKGLDGLAALSELHQAV